MLGRIFAKPRLALGDTSTGQRDLQRLSQPRVSVTTQQTVKGLNFFNPVEQRLLQTLQHGEFNIHSWRRSECVHSKVMSRIAAPMVGVKILLT